MGWWWLIGLLYNYSQNIRTKKNPERSNLPKTPPSVRERHPKTWNAINIQTDQRQRGPSVSRPITYRLQLSTRKDLKNNCRQPHKNRPIGDQFQSSFPKIACITLSIYKENLSFFTSQVASLFPSSKFLKGPNQQNFCSDPENFSVV